MVLVLHKGADTYEIFEAHSAPSDREYMEFLDENSTQVFLRGFLTDPHNQNAIRAFASTSQLHTRLTGDSDERILESMAWQIAGGQLKVAETIYEGPHRGGEDAPATRTPEPVGTGPRVARRVQRKDWIEIQLIDQDNQPVAKEKYRITWPDGSTKSEGKTDFNGLARVDPIDVGTCQICFPDLHETDWVKL